MKPKLLGGRTGRWTIEMTMIGGRTTEISSDDWDLHDSVIEELKAIQTFQRQVVRSWGYKQGEVSGKQTKKSLV